MMGRVRGIDKGLVKEGVTLLRILVNEDRRRIIKLLRNNKLSVSQIAKTLNISTACTVYHLDVLESVGIIESDYERIAPRKFLEVHYVNEEKLGQILKTIEKFIQELKRRLDRDDDSSKEGREKCQN